MATLAEQMLDLERIGLDSPLSDAVNLAKVVRAAVGDLALLAISARKELRTRLSFNLFAVVVTTLLPIAPGAPGVLAC